MFGYLVYAILTLALVHPTVEIPIYEEPVQEIREELVVYEHGYFRSDIPLDADTQSCLYAACEEFDIPFELALAVVHQETNFQNIVGDGGDSIGYMQIQPRWHYERMERLGVSDLSDPCGNFRVGCDILAELLAKYDIENALTVYNRGTPGKSDYAASVLAYMETLAQN